jgi:hypothetical protein
MCFLKKIEGLSRAMTMIFLVGRIMMLGELLTGHYEWGLSSRSWGPGMGQLVTGSRFLRPAHIVLGSIRLVSRARCLSSRRNHGSCAAKTRTWAGMPTALMRLGTGR